jgi:hypothetical protein
MVHKQHLIKKKMPKAIVVESRPAVSETKPNQVPFDYEPLGRGAALLDSPRVCKITPSQEHVEQWLDSLECEHALRNLGIKR